MAVRARVCTAGWPCGLDPFNSARMDLSFDPAPAPLEVPFPEVRVNEKCFNCKKALPGSPRTAFCRSEGRHLYAIIICSLNICVKGDCPGLKSRPDAPQKGLRPAIFGSAPWLDNPFYGQMPGKSDRMTTSLTISHSHPKPLHTHRPAARSPPAPCTPPRHF